MSENTANPEVLRAAIDQARATSDTYSRVFLLIQQQAAERAAAVVEQAEREHQAELFQLRLTHMQAALQQAADTFDQMYQTALAAPVILRPGLLGLVRQAAAKLVATSGEAGGDAEAIAGVLDTQILELGGPRQLEDKTPADDGTVRVRAHQRGRKQPKTA